MNPVPRLARTTLSLLAIGVLLTNGCALPHAQLRTTPIGKVEPANYCPGDTVTASYDLLAPDVCTSRPGMDCAALQPTITTRSAPESFPEQTATATANRVDFVPTAGAVDVSFSLAGTRTTQFLIFPIIDSMGTPTTIGKFVANNTARTTRIEGSGSYELTFDGICNGPQPGYAPTTLPGPPAFSGNLQLGEICNTTSGVILADVGGSPVMLRPGECRAPGPGAPIAAGAPVTLLSAPINPGARCSSVEGGNPPADLRLRVTMSCR